ncbi:MAG: hypothetical protein Q9184_004385, partial [Pyrenodesmia sp. 2 TL-2023]
ERPFIPEPVASLYNRHAGRKTRPSLEEIRSAIQAVVSNHTKVYVVIDALDEYLDQDGSRSQLLSMLRELQSTGCLHLMVTSRFIPDVVQQFSHSPMLEIRASDFDVKRFIGGQIHRLPRCVQRDNELQETIQDRISTAVDGMFLLARLHVDSLLDKGTKKKILSTLDGLPKGSEALDKAYKDAIQRIEGQLPGKSEQAKRVLSWITYAQRPLSTEELRHALAVELGDSELDLDNIPDVEDMVSDCAGLVVVDDESNIIRLVHYTTQEYFERTRETWNPQAQQEIASVCLTYLSFDIFASGASASDEDFKTMIAENAFYDYAAMNWAIHSLTVQKEISQLALPFLQHEGLVNSTFRMISLSTHGSYPNPQGPDEITGLHLTAMSGLSLLTDELLRVASGTTSITANSRDGSDRTPLLWAAENGHEAVVKLLLARDDVEADSKDIYYSQTPLSWAAENGHEAVVKILLARDVEANSKNTFGQTPLWRAAENGYEAVVKLLLARDNIETDSKDSIYAQTPLSRAAGYGHEAVVKLLLALDNVEANTKDTRSQTPLWRAAEEGYEAIVKLLLARDDVEADSKDRYSQTPLSRAADNGHEAVVELLLARDNVDVNSKDSDGITPLFYALVAGHEGIVKLLLARADIEADSKDEFGRTLLSYATEYGYEAIVKLLLARDDVEANSKDIDGRTPLSWAVQGSYEAVVKLLLARDDIEANSKDMDSRTPLSWAAKSRYDAVVKLLLARDDIEVDSDIAKLVLARKEIKADSKMFKLESMQDDIGWDSEVVKLLLARKEIQADSELVELLLARLDIEADSETM